MNIAVIGTGYVGLPTGTGFAELGHNVVCVDQIEAKIRDLNNGKITLYEAGLEEIFQKNRASGKLKFTTQMADGVAGADVVIIAVGTPINPITKESDMKYVHAAAGELAQYLTGYTVVAVKSTVPVGAGDDIEKIISNGNPKADFDVVSLPEFLREGFAVEDFFNPDRIIIGTESERAKTLMAKLYEPFKDKSALLFVSRRSSEAIKYAANSFLAIKVHYINEIANFCEKSGADIDELAKGMGLDSRIGMKFLHPGPGYGGSCFPKDTAAMAVMAQKFNIRLNLIETAIEHNSLRKREMAERVIHSVRNIKNPIIAALGLTFKGGTDDVRESPAMDIVQELLNAGLIVKVYDPKGVKNAEPILKDSVYYSKGAEDACKDADVCLILTEWQEFKELNYSNIYGLMRTPVIMDLRNILNGQKVREAGFKYYSIGRKYQS